MEANGVVGPEEGTKPRKVLMDANQLELFLRERHKK
jgi:DNA segregation ATPase FtsK/SpoIIIE-like protein